MLLIAIGLILVFHVCKNLIQILSVNRMGFILALCSVIMVFGTVGIYSAKAPAQSTKHGCDNLDIKIVTTPH